MASLLLSTLSLLGLVAVDPVRLLALVWEPNEPHRSLVGAAVLAWPGDGVADASVGQPASITAVVALELPGGVNVPDLGDLCAVIHTRLHGLIEGQPVGLHQPIETPW